MPVRITAPCHLRRASIAARRQRTLEGAICHAKRRTCRWRVARCRQSACASSVNIRTAVKASAVCSAKLVLAAGSQVPNVARGVVGGRQGIDAGRGTRLASKRGSGSGPQNGSRDGSGSAAASGEESRRQSPDHPPGTQACGGAVIACVFQRSRAGRLSKSAAASFISARPPKLGSLGTYRKRFGMQSANG
jgi:hypothetical protein